MTIAEAYGILGLDKTADRHALKRALHRLAKKCHPDKTRRKSAPASRSSRGR